MLARPQLRLEADLIHIYTLFEAVEIWSVPPSAHFGR